MGIPAISAALKEDKLVAIPQGYGYDPGGGVKAIQEAAPGRVELAFSSPWLATGQLGSIRSRL